MPLRKSKELPVEPLVRKYVLECLGAHRVRIQRNSDVRALGVMPRSGQHGWYLVGTVASLRERALAFQRRGQKVHHARLGRPLAALPGARHNVYLRQTVVAFLRAAGGGSLSRGIQIAAQQLADATRS